MSAPSTNIPAQMVMELAAKIQPVPDILARYDIDPTEFRHKILPDPQFRAAFSEAKRFWNSDTNAKERIAIKAQAMVEDSLLELYTLFHDGAKNPTARIEALKTMMRLARVDAGEPKEATGATGRAVHIHIDMGERTIEREITGITIDQAGDADE
jgi:hypothetical protein